MHRPHVLLLATAAFSMVVTTMALTAQTPQRAPVKPLVDADNKRMNPEQGLVSTTVFGDPSKPGIYVIRNRFAPGITSRPHFHDQDRFVTVIKGTWWTDEGDVFRPDKMVPIKEGRLHVSPRQLPSLRRRERRRGRGADHGDGPREDRADRSGRERQSGQAQAAWRELTVTSVLIKGSFNAD